MSSAYTLVHRSFTQSQAFSIQNRFTSVLEEATVATVAAIAIAMVMVMVSIAIATSVATAKASESWTVSTRAKSAVSTGINISSDEYRCRNWVRWNDDSLGAGLQGYYVASDNWTAQQFLFKHLSMKVSHSNMWARVICHVVISLAFICLPKSIWRNDLRKQPQSYIMLTHNLHVHTRRRSLCKPLNNWVLSEVCSLMNNIYP